MVPLLLLLLGHHPSLVEGLHKPDKFPPEKFNLTSASCYDPKEDTSFCRKTKFSISKRGVSYSYCEDEDGVYYKAGVSVASCSNCFTYTCTYGEDGRKGKYLRWVLTSIASECCQGCSGRVAPPDTVMGTATMKDPCSTLVTNVCKYNPGWSSKVGVVTKSYTPQSCCADQNDLFPIDTGKFDPPTCSWKTCREGNYWSTKPVLPGKCDCCVYNNKLVADGEVVHLKTHIKMKCCQGEMVKVKNEPPARCKLPRDPGTCRTFMERWWFNNSTCQEFYYGGCQGNPNRFVSLDQCMDVCALDVRRPLKIHLAVDDSFTLYSGAPGIKPLRRIGVGSGFRRSFQFTTGYGIEYLTVTAKDLGYEGGILFSATDGKDVWVSDTNWQCRVKDGDPWAPAKIRKVEDGGKEVLAKFGLGRWGSDHQGIDPAAFWIWHTEKGLPRNKAKGEMYNKYEITCYLKL